MQSTHSDRERGALIDIRQNIELALSFAEGLTYEQFRNDTRSFYAVMRALEIVSEASRRLSEDLKARHAGIPWKEMAGAGNIYRHDYQNVVQHRVWRTVQEALPLLLRAVDDELGSSASPPT